MTSDTTSDVKTETHTDGYSISGKLHLSALRLKLALLQSIKKRSHGRMQRPKPVDEAVMETLGQVGSTSSTDLEVRPEKR